ncbi:MAG: M20/M25/M40 family metallo-hydrolase [Desulfomicrobium escambiense]|nr:M20/M25/M40 family metallo-hydrolase [Desulfomicrobium escambiense]
MVESLRELVKIPAISPRDGGHGELAKAEWLAGLVVRLGLPAPQRFDAPDPTAPGRCRAEPGRENSGTHSPKDLVRFTPGRGSRRRSVLVGNGSLPTFRGREGRVYGRGSNDNGQELIASLYAAAAYTRLGLLPETEIGLAFVADEELGSACESVTC